MKIGRMASKRAIAFKRSIRVAIQEQLIAARDELSDALVVVENVRWNTVAGREASDRVAHLQGKVAALEEVLEFVAALKV